MNSDRIKAILADEDFAAIVDKTREVLAKKVLGKKTTDEDRVIALAEYHALDSVMAIMRSEAQNSKEKTHE